MSTAKQKILIVDDEPDILELIEYNLKKEGYQVYLASNGQDGINVAKKVQPDLIILDIMMPKMDGFTLAEKCVNYNPDTPFLFLTARNQSEDKIKGLKLGADDYIIKPFEMEFWQGRSSRLHDRIQYSLHADGHWVRVRLAP